MAIVPSFIQGGDKINQAITNFLEGGVVGIDTIRSVDYGSNYLWTLDFVTTPELNLAPPFDRFFPASDVTLNTAIINSQTVEQGQSSFSFPKNDSVRTIDITFYDDDKRNLQCWMSDWINIDILNGGQFMSGLKDNHDSVIADSFGATRKVSPTRQIKLALLNRSRQDALVYNFMIIPDGQLDFQGTQASEATQFSMKFNIVEQIGSVTKSNKSASVFRQVLKQLTGRFF